MKNNTTTVKELTINQLTELNEVVVETGLPFDVCYQFYMYNLSTNKPPNKQMEEIKNLALIYLKKQGFIEDDYDEEKEQEITLRVNENPFESLPIVRGCVVEIMHKHLSFKVAVTYLNEDEDEDDYFYGIVIESPREYIKQLEDAREVKFKLENVFDFIPNHPLFKPDLHKAPII